MENKPLDELVIRFFEILDQTEESDAGRVFHPTTISSCRVMVCQELRELLPALKDTAYEEQQKRQMREWGI